MYRPGRKSRMNTLSRVSFFVLVGIAMFGAGCVAVAAGAGLGVAGYEFSQGELQYSVYANVDKSRKATDDVIRQRGWEVKERTRDVTTAYFRCITKDGTQVKVDISRRSPDFTRVAVRYGVFGDELESRKFIDEVKARL
jgi:hypothetical protein